MMLIVRHSSFISTDGAKQANIIGVGGRFTLPVKS